ncbi:ribosome-releasing factor 2, mitochondrial-like [Oscarella lobularis]|uniref:ribosome-releasing factor 2, mitochondrial-like n=1 Tax=Oscarella lobularis TaxID=121494 RepID=UPI00331436ED
MFRFRRVRRVSRAYTTSLTNEAMKRIRNIGIIAHVDAGKTTTTERMLYLAKATRRMGDVDAGTTVTDYMDQERTRGITVTSAAVTFQWKGHRINLIDTPGHVDFTIEVERSLRVLDGVVAILDGVAGVEAQTLSVWKQSDAYRLPKICFINKMDRPGANFDYCVEAIQSKLGADPLVTQLAIGSGRNFEGVLDLLTMRARRWHGGKMSEWAALSDDASSLRERAQTARRALIEKLADADEKTMECLVERLTLAFDSIAADEIRAGIARATCAGAVVPIVCGSALKGVGIDAVLDSVVDFLPPPPADESANEYAEEPRALAFKVLHDKQRGPLVFLRLYSGRLRPHTALYNVNRERREKATRLIEIFANEQREIKELLPGNIGVAVGFKETVTGDTLVSLAGHKKSREALAGLSVPDPVFYCTIEPDSASLQKDLDHALTCLAREDPSLRVVSDPESGRTILKGMGELHLEIVEDRIRKDFGVAASLGPLQIAYRETITSTATETANRSLSIGGQLNEVDITLRLSSATGRGPVETVTNECAKTRDAEIIEAVRSGIISACSRGPLVACPVVDVEVALLSLTTSPSASLSAVARCANECALKALSAAGPALLEPRMHLQISTPEEHLSAVLSDLSSLRSGIVEEVQTRQDFRVVLATAPLARLRGYAKEIRKLTHGTATFTMEFNSYALVAPHMQERTLKELKSFVY